MGAKFRKAEVILKCDRCPSRAGWLAWRLAEAIRAAKADGWAFSVSRPHQDHAAAFCPACVRKYSGNPGKQWKEATS